MFTLNEALKIAGLPQKKLNEATDPSVRKALNQAKDELEGTKARYKDIEIYSDKKEIEWVTQETDEWESERAAETIADIFGEMGLDGWKIKVVGRSYWGNADDKTPWSVATSKK